MTADLSSKSIAVVCDTPITGALTIDLWIDWPVLLEGKHPLRLVVHGRITRTAGPLAVVRIVRHEFRTARAPVMTAIAGV